MIDEDEDGLPVLTQVLRTGNAAPGVAIRAEAHGDRAGGNTGIDTSPMTDELVIGNDAQSVTHPVGSDAFALPQDHDATPDDVAMFALDEPDFAEHARSVGPASHRVDAAVGAIVEPLALAFDVGPLDVATGPSPTPAEDPAAAALRVRDAVLNDLLARIGPELDARIAQALHAEVETAVGQLQYNLRHQLGDALRDVVGRAVADEMRAIETRAEGSRPH